MSFVLFPGAQMQGTWGAATIVAEHSVWHPGHPPGIKLDSFPLQEMNTRNGCFL